MFFHGAVQVKIKYLKQDNKMFSSQSKNYRKENNILCLHVELQTI